MTFRLALQPAWLQFLELTLFFAVFWGAGQIVLSSSSVSSIWRNTIFGLVFGAIFAAVLQYQRRPWYRRFVEAVAGLGKTERSQAIGAITHGVMPTDPTVRSAAIQLGWVHLAGKSAEQLKRQERQNWILTALLVVLMITCAVLYPGFPAKVYFLALGLLVALLLPLQMRRDRRILRNVALLTEGLTSR